METHVYTETNSSSTTMIQMAGHQQYSKEEIDETTLINNNQIATVYIPATIDRSTWNILKGAPIYTRHWKSFSLAPKELLAPRSK